MLMIKINLLLNTRTCSLNGSLTVFAKLFLRFFIQNHSCLSIWTLNMTSMFANPVILFPESIK